MNYIPNCIFYLMKKYQNIPRFNKYCDTLIERMSVNYSRVRNKRSHTFIIRLNFFCGYLLIKGGQFISCCFSLHTLCKIYPWATSILERATFIQGVALIVLKNVPPATFIPPPMSIQYSRVVGDAWIYEKNSSISSFDGNSYFTFDFSFDLEDFNLSPPSFQTLRHP